jgi:hypothetical protein
VSFKASIRVDVDEFAALGSSLETAASSVTREVISSGARSSRLSNQFGGGPMGGARIQDASERTRCSIGVIVIRLAWMLVLLVASGFAGGSALAASSLPVDSRPRGLVLSNGPAKLIGYRLDGTGVFWSPPPGTLAHAVSPDLRSVAYVVPRDRRGYAMRVRERDGHSDRRIGTFPSASVPVAPSLFWSPSNDEIASGYDDVENCKHELSTAVSLRVFFTSDREELVVQAAPGAPRFLAEGRTVAPLAWSPDGSELLYNVTTRFVEDSGECGTGAGSTLSVLDLRSGKTHVVARSADTIAFAEFALDGRGVLYLDGSGFGGVPYIASVDGRSRRRLDRHVVDDAGFSPDGQEIALLERPGDGRIHLIVVRRDGSDRRQIATAPSGSPNELVWTRTWHIIALMNGRLVVTDLRPAVERTLRQISIGRCAGIWPSATGEGLAIEPETDVASCSELMPEPEAVLVLSFRSARTYLFNMFRAQQRRSTPAVPVVLWTP